jgi:hypothetical protein
MVRPQTEVPARIERSSEIGPSLHLAQSARSPRAAPSWGLTMCLRDA